MNAERIAELERWAHALRQQLPLHETIDIIKKRTSEASEEDACQLTHILISMLIEARREVEAAQIINDKMRAMPNDVRFAIAKANLCLYFLDNPECALEAIDQALDRAHRSRSFRREALGVRARILLRLGRGEFLSRTLEEIMALQIAKGDPDIGIERDFVDRAPAGMIFEDVFARYNAFCPRSRTT